MLTRDDVRHLCGELADWKIAKIIASNASYEELETAVMWAQGEALGPEHEPLEGQVAYLYEILMAGEEWDEERAR
jgi:hypothetical protein